MYRVSHADTQKQKERNLLDFAIARGKNLA